MKSPLRPEPNCKARQRRAFLSFEGHYLRLWHCLAGDAVLIAPVSTKNPC